MKGVVFVLSVVLLLSIVSAEKNQTDDELLCNELYYFILSEGWNYNDAQFMEFVNSINQSYSKAEEYLIENYELCYLKGYTPIFPKISSENKLIINRTSKKCNLKIIDEFFDYGIPFFKISLGQVSCENAKILVYFFWLERIGDNYKITGIKIWFLFIFAFLYVLKKIFF